MVVGVLVPDSLEDCFEAAEEKDLVARGVRADALGDWKFGLEEVDEEEICSVEEVDCWKPVMVGKIVSLDLHDFEASPSYSWVSIAEVNGVGRIGDEAGYSGAVLLE